METSAGAVAKERYAWLFVEVSEEEILFYRRFVWQHGGAFEPVEQPADGYRLDFPPGTRIVPNQESGLSLRDSYHLVYPDGVRVTWYRAMMLDGRLLRDVLLVPVDEQEDWALFERESCGAAD